MRVAIVVGVLLCGCGRGPSETEKELRLDVQSYCDVLPSSYRLASDAVRAGHYDDAQTVWLPPDAVTNVHRYFDFCLRTSRLSAPERQEVFKTYADLRESIRPLLVHVLEDPTARTDENRLALSKAFDQARSLAERIVATSPK